MIAKSRLNAILLTSFSVPSLAQIHLEVNGRYEDLSNDVWDRLMSSPNATANTQEVIGYNFTETFPGTPIDGWTLSYAVVGNGNWWSSHSLTGAQMSYQPPRSQQHRTVHRSWQHCARFFLVDYDEGSNVDSTCRGVLSDQCYRELRDLVDEGVDPCHEEETPASCRDELRDNNRLTRNWLGEGEYTVGLTAHGPDDFGLYDDMLRKVTIATLGFFAIGEDYEMLDEHVPGILNCFRPDNVTSGSRVPEEGAALLLGVDKTWAAVVLSATLIWALV